MTDDELFALCESLGIERLHWNPRKTDIVGLCPFHMESRSSFAVSSEKLLYNCYSCHAKGHLDQMVARIKGLDTLPRARQYIAKFGDYDSPEFTADTFLSFGREKDDNVHCVSVAMYAAYVTRKRQRIAQAYLEKRGIIYRKTGIPKCGIEFGYDPVQDRVMIPCDDKRGFYGCEGRLRKEREGLARYMPYFGLQKAYHLFVGMTRIPRDCNGYVIVESFIDAIIVSQLYERTGLVGIALGKSDVTKPQLKKLRAIGGPFKIGLDNDDAGISGTKQVYHSISPYCVTDTVEWPEKDASRCTKKQILIALKRPTFWI